MPRILIADDDARITEALRRLLELEGYETATAHDGEEALRLLAGGGIDAVLLDLDMPRMDGTAALRAMRERGHDAPVLIVSGKGTIQRAVEAVRLGAQDFIEKPVDDCRLLLSLRNALEQDRLRGEVERLRDDRAGFGAGVGTGIVAESPEMRRVVEEARRVAATGSTVLLTGETGTGKEVVAGIVHAASPRRERAFVKLNCAALPADLAESELFGHVRGSFTGALRDRKGRFQLADKGTLLLDEVGELTAPLQAKLLRALAEGEFEPLGAERTLKADVRVIAATNRDLAEAVRAGAFREDLYYRLAVIVIEVPPLRARPADVAALAARFLAARARAVGRPGLALDEGAVAALQAYAWPGNVRELRNVVERLSVTAPADRIVAGDVARALPSGAADAPPVASTLAGALGREERRKIEEALARSDGNVAAAARALGIERSHFYRKLKRHGLK